MLLVGRRKAFSEWLWEQARVRTDLALASNLDSLGPDLVSPFWQSKAKDDPAAAEMLRINKGVSAPGRPYTQDGERLDYAPEEFDRYDEIEGRLTYNRLLALIGSARYSEMSEDAQRKAAKKEITAARREARAVLSSPDYPPPVKGEAMSPAGDEWDAFPHAEPVDGLEAFGSELGAS